MSNLTVRGSRLVVFIVLEISCLGSPKCVPVYNIGEKCYIERSKSSCMRIFPSLGLWVGFTALLLIYKLISFRLSLNALYILSETRSSSLKCGETGEEASTLHCGDGGRLSICFGVGAVRVPCLVFRACI